MRALLALVLLIGGSVNALAVVCTLDPSNVGANITLSNGNKTWASTSTANTLGRGTLGYLAGSGVTNASYKLYFEMFADSALGGGNFWGVGIDAGTDSVANFLGGTSAGVGLYNAGNATTNNATGATYFTWTSSATIGVAVDFFHQKVWWTKDGVTWNNDIIANQNPVNNTGGFGTFTAPGVFGGSGNPYATVYPAFGTINRSANSGTFNGGQSAFTLAMPSGFIPWCGAPASTPQYFRVSP